MSAGRVLGGLFALFGGVFVMIAVFLRSYELTSGFQDQIIRWIINLIICLFAIIGGILAIARKGGAGALTLIAGILAFLMSLIANLVNSSDLAYWFSPYSGLKELTGWGIFLLTDAVTLFWYFAFEGFLIFLGAILILNSRDRYRD
jgi:hypothetical protein